MHGPATPKTATHAAESPRSYLGRFGDRDAPWENEVCKGRNHSHKAANTPESLRSCRDRLGNRDAPWENEVFMCQPLPKRRRMHPSPPGPAWAALGIGTPRGRTRYAHAPTTPHSGEYTRVFGPAWTAWGIGTPRGRTRYAQGATTPTQQGMHPSPSGLAWAALGIGAPRGRTRYAWDSHSQNGGTCTRVPVVLPRPLWG